MFPNGEENCTHVQKTWSISYLTMVAKPTQILIKNIIFPFHWLHLLAINTYYMFLVYLSYNLIFRINIILL
jgi:hypothetical protein